MLSYNFQFITHEDNNYINCRENIFKDSTGLLWLATPSSLLLYDGKSITNFSKEDPIYKVDFPNIQLFNKTADGNLIIVSSSNLFYLFNPYTKQIIYKTSPDEDFKDHLENTLSSDQTGSIFMQNQLVPDDDGGYYALLEGKDKRQYVFHSVDGSSLDFKKAFSISGISHLEYSGGELFLSDSMSIMQLDTSLNVLNRHELQFSRSQTPFIFKDDENTIWAYENCTTDNCYVYKFDSQSNAFIEAKLPSTIDLNGIHKMKKEKGLLWLFGVNKLIQVDLDRNLFQDVFPLITKSFESLDSPPLISHYISVLTDDQDMVWLPSGYGLVQLIPEQDMYEVLLRSDPVYCNGFCSMRGIGIDKQGTLWLASYSGLLKYSAAGDLSKVKELDEYLLDGIYSLSLKDPYLLVNDLLYNIETKEIKELVPEKQNQHVTNAVGANNDFWIATCYADGNNIDLYHYDLDSKSLAEIEIPAFAKRSGQITDLVLSRDKQKLWMTTANNGSLEYTIDSQTFRSITPEKYWDHDDTRHYCIYENKDNELFIGTSRSLLQVDVNSNRILEHNKVNKSTESSIDRHIFSLLPENDSVLWIGSDKGIMTFNMLNSNFSKLSQFGKIGSEEFNRESSFKSQTGEMIFGSVNGVYIIDPENLISFKNSDPQKVSLISAQHYDGETNEIVQLQSDPDNNNRYSLQHNDKMVSFKVSMPEFRPFQKIYYSYLLEGFQETWSIPSDENIIRFTNLDPGDYALHVKGGSDINSLSSELFSIDLVISDAWYNSLWFKLLLLVSFIGVLISVFSIRYAQLLKYQNLRSEISKNLHDDVGTMLTGIAMQSEMMEKIASEENKDIARGIALRSREAMINMRDTVWAIDSGKDTTMDLKDRILDYIQDTLYPKDIGYSIKSNITKSDMKIMPHIRQNIYLITKESINNIVKHSNTEKVEISLDVTKKTLSLIIKDFGSLSKIKSSGQGLKNMKERANAIGGTYTFEYDQGYTTTVLVPVNL